MPMLMNSEVAYAKTTLPYPIYAADFDPYNRGYLVVGGGGGQGRSGVPNQIVSRSAVMLSMTDTLKSVLDVSNRATISTALDIDLSNEEDSVSSLANLATKDGLITFAGINSSEANQSAGKNEHFRTFHVQYPPRKKQKTDEAGQNDAGAINLLGKRSLFRPSSAANQETYQRLLRLSPAQKKDSSTKRIGAVASGLAKTSEIVVFNATVSSVEDADILTKIELPEKAEAADLDIALTDESEFSLAYCDDHNIYEQTFQYDFDKKTVQKRPKGARRVHQMPFPDTFENPKNRPKYRCLRFLNSQNVLTLLNNPNKGGAELRIYHLYPTGPAIEMLRKSLPSHIKQATSLDVCALDTDKNGNQQVVIAVAGQDISIEVYTTDYHVDTDTFSRLKNYNTFRDVHPQQMTKVCFAPFHSPSRAPDPKAITTDGPNGEPVPHMNPANLHPITQYIRLASTSFGNTVVVDTFPLTPFDLADRESRYVLVHPNDEAIWRWVYIILVSFVVLVTAFLAQSFMGFSGDEAGFFNIIPKDIRDFLDQPARAAYNRDRMTRVTRHDAATTPSVSVDQPALKDVIASHHVSPEDALQTAVIVRDVPEGDGLSVNVHPDKEAYLETDASAKHWHELEDHQKSYWKEKLIKAGRWAEGEGEAVLQGALWSTYAGLVGQAAQEILREL